MASAGRAQIRRHGEETDSLLAHHADQDYAGEVGYVEAGEETLCCFLRLQLLSPEWLDSAQIRRCPYGGSHGGLHSRILAPGEQSGREDPFQTRSPAAQSHRRNQVLMYGNVIELAETVLQTLESLQELLPPLR